RNNAIAAWEVARAGFRPHGHLAYKRAVLFRYVAVKGKIFGRVGTVEPARQHGHGSRLQARTVRRGVDAAGKPGNNRKSSFAKIIRQAFCKTCADYRSVARTHNGNRRLAENAGTSLDR